MAPLLWTFGDSNLIDSFVTQPHDNARQMVKAAKDKTKCNTIFDKTSKYIVPISIEPLTKKDVADARRKDNPFHELARSTNPYTVPERVFFGPERPDHLKASTSSSESRASVIASLPKKPDGKGQLTPVVDRAATTDSGDKPDSLV